MYNAFILRYTRKTYPVYYRTEHNITYRNLGNNPQLFFNPIAFEANITIRNDFNNCIIFCNDIRSTSNHITFYKNGTALTLERHYLGDESTTRTGYVVLGPLSKGDVIEVKRTGNLPTAGTCYMLLFDAATIERM